jgi:hypothetical protein
MFILSFHNSQTVEKVEVTKNQEMVKENMLYSSGQKISHKEK